MSNFQVDLGGKVALVTGGSLGLGKAMSIGLADAGASVVIASRSIEKCESVAGIIRSKGGNAYAIAADTAVPESLDNLIDKTYQHYGRLDILVNNAATDANGLSSLDKTSVEWMDLAYQVNVRGPWYLASRAAPRMGADGGGSIINVVSVSGLKPVVYAGAYSASKAALNALTKVMAQEWAPLNIRVNSLAPGSYHSAMFDKNAEEIPGFEKRTIDRNLIKRIPASEEIVGPILYLASDACNYTTGSVLVSDGGYLTKS